MFLCVYIYNLCTSVSPKSCRSATTASSGNSTPHTSNSRNPSRTTPSPLPPTASETGEQQ